MTRAEFAAATGYTLGTMQEYAQRGLLPPPAMRLGRITLYDRDSVELWKRVHKGRPNGRKSVRMRKR